MPEFDIGFLVGFIVAIIAFIGLEAFWKFYDKKEEPKEDRDDLDIYYFIKALELNLQYLEKAEYQTDARMAINTFNELIVQYYETQISPTIKLDSQE